MGNLIKKTKLSCEQVYNLWASEPYLIKILDLRNEKEFLESHIPGAKNILAEQINEELNNLGDKLAVLIAPDELESLVNDKIQNRSDFVFMSQCHRWMELNNPVIGSKTNIMNLDLKQLRGEIMDNNFIFQQLFEPKTSTYTYIIADNKTKEAAIIDPVLETVERDLKLIEELGLKLIYVLDTHIHADHITGAGEIRKRTQAKTAVSRNAEVTCVDIPLEDNQELLLGDKKIKIISTPGHTNTCVSYLFEGMIFTGDSLLIRGCGRTDFQQGLSDNLYESVHNKLYKLPDNTIVYPGHDYRGQTKSVIGLEKKFNPRLAENKSREEFKKIMSELKLDNPKQIHEAVPANLACGTPKTERLFHPQIVDGVPEITTDDVKSNLSLVNSKKIRLIDVRRKDEFNNEYGHIHGAELITLGPELSYFLEKGDRNQEIVFICRSGGRSGAATVESIKLGYKHTMNMIGGMINWNDKNYPTEK